MAELIKQNAIKSESPNAQIGIGPWPEMSLLDDLKPSSCTCKQKDDKTEVPPST
jgi:hypothetical protein